MKRAALTPICLLICNGCQGTRSGARLDVRQIVDYNERVVGASGARVPIPAVDAYLSSVGNRVLEAAKAAADEKSKAAAAKTAVDPYSRFNVYLLHDPSENALTYGDDFAIITTAMFLRLDTADELAAILCHEFAHIVKEHRVAYQLKIRQERDKTVALAALAGGLAGAAGQGQQLPMAVVRLRQQFMATYRPYDKNDEFEADAYGLEIYAKMGFDIERYGDFLNLLVELQGEGGGLTHPRNSERIARVSEAIKRHRGASAPTQTLDPSELNRAQQFVAGAVFELRDRNSLFSIGDVYAYMQSRGYQTYPADACGALGGDAVALNARFWSRAAQFRNGPAQP